MSATDAADLEAGGNSLGSGATGGGGGGGCRGARRLRSRSGRRRRRPSMAFFSSDANTDGGSSLGFSDSDDQSSAHFDSSFAADECGSSGIFSYPHSHRQSLSDEADLESGELEVKVHSGKDEKRCRICHLKFTVPGNGGRGDQSEEEEEDGGGAALELGCNCKGDLGAAHQQCAETWFKIRGNMICEICGATAQNVAVEQTNEASNVTETEATETIEASASAPVLLVPTEQRSFWQGRRIMNFLLACMVFAFIISWLFHFNILP